MTDRSAIIEKLRRLMAMTVENGASEAEAIIAAEKAAALMAEHNLSYATVEEITAEAYADDERPWFRGSMGRDRAAPIPPVVHCLNAICDLTGTLHMFSRYRGSLVFFGPKHATEVAHYLVVILSRAMDREWASYRTTLRRSQVRRYRGPFFLGIASRIDRRLRDMIAAQRRSDAAPSETDETAMTASAAMAVVRVDILKQKFTDAHPKITETRAGHRLGPQTNRGALIDGIRAGDNVAINQGIAQARGTKLIGAE